MMSSYRLILVDGMAVLYRAFYAIRELSTASGRPTNAVFGFIRMIRQMEKVWGPTHIGVVFDGGLPESRTEVVPEYKAQRAPMPDELREQIDTVQEFLDRSDIPWAREDGVEADDILASVAVWAQAEADQVLVATSDKDLYQIVNEKIQIIAVSGNNEIMGSDDVQHKTGVAPSQIVDWLSLVGDSSDNIPGVRGVGPKKAAKLLVDYGSMAGIWEQLHAMPSSKLKEALERDREVAERNVGVVTLDTGMECPFEWVGLERTPPDADNLLPFFDELEFDSMARELREPELL